MRVGVLSLAIALLAAFGLFILKDQVQRREDELHGLQVAIAAERAALNRLRAEWAMLNQPSRIARLAADHLELQPAQPGQIVAIEAIPLRADLELGNRQLTAMLPSGVEVPLRLKPPQLLSLPGLASRLAASARGEAR
jgi:cell division protein FtsL